MQISFDKIVDKIAIKLHLPKIVYQKNHIECRCPLCGDSKTKDSVRRFHIDFHYPYNTFIYKCYRCGESGDMPGLYSILYGVEYETARKILSNKKYDPNLVKDFFEIKTQKTDEIQKVKTKLDINIEKETFDLSYEPNSKFEENIYKKLLSFKLNRKIPDSLPLYIAHSGRYKSRIIVPIYINNELVYFQGRSIYDETTPKYLNPDVEKSNIIMNVDKFDPNKWIVVTEGIIDAAMVDYNQGTCVLGGSVDSEYTNRIMDYTNKGVIICLDNPKIDDNAYNVLKKLVNEKIKKYKENIRFFIIPNEFKSKDLNALVVDYHISNVYDFVVKNSINIPKMKLFLMKIDK